MRTIVASFVASSLLVSSSFAATQSVPLPAGKPAGVHQAALQGSGNLFLILISAGIAIGGLALAISNPSGDGVTTPTTVITTTTTTDTTSGTSS